MTSNSEDDLPEVRQIELQDGEVTLKFPCVDGIGIVPFPGIVLNGPAEQFRDIRNLETNTCDILLATFAKAGTYMSC